MLEAEFKDKEPTRSRLLRLHEDIRASLSTLTIRVLEGMMIAPVMAQRSARASLRGLRSPRVTNRERTAHLVNLADAIVPGLAGVVSKKLYRTHLLPFADQHPQLIAYGKGSTVFLLNTDRGAKVLKVYRRSLGKRGEDLFGVLDAYRAKYNMICEWYNGPFNLVIPSSFLIVNGPVLNQPVAASIQPHIGASKSDLLQDHTDAEIVRMMRENAELREQFIYFASRTLYVYSNYGIVLDLLGYENIVLINDEGRQDLLILDPGVLSIERLQKQRPAKVHTIRQVMVRLESLLESV